MNVDELSLTKLLVYGTVTPGDDPNTHIRPDNAPAPVQTYKMSDYLDITSGQGRYARPSSSLLIQKFFSDSKKDDPKLKANTTYSAAELRKALGLSSANDLSFAVNNYFTGGDSSDFLERSYAFGSSAFFLKDDLVFKIGKDRKYTVLNLELIAKEDDFDYQSSNLVASTANVALANAFDPYGLIPQKTTHGSADTTGVRIVYTGSGREYSVYTEKNFEEDTAFFAKATSISSKASGAAEFAKALAGLGTKTGYLGLINANKYFDYYAADGKKLFMEPTKMISSTDFHIRAARKLGQRLQLPSTISTRWLEAEGKTTLPGGYLLTNYGVERVMIN